MSSHYVWKGISAQTVGLSEFGLCNDPRVASAEAFLAWGVLRRQGYVRPPLTLGKISKESLQKH